MTALFKTREAAERGFQNLLDLGYDRDDISVLMSEESRTRYYSSDRADSELGSKAAEGTGVGSAIGGTVGAVLAAIAAIHAAWALGWRWPGYDDESLAERVVGAGAQLPPEPVVWAVAALLGIGAAVVAAVGAGRRERSSAQRRGASPAS